MAKYFKEKQKLLLQHYPRAEVQLNVCYNVVGNQAYSSHAHHTLLTQMYRYACFVIDYRIRKVALG